VADELPRIARMLALTPGQQTSFDAALAEMKQRAAARVATPQQGEGNRLFVGGRGGPGGGVMIRGGASAPGAAMGAMRQRMQERFNQQFAAFRATLDDKQAAIWDREIGGLLLARRAPLYKLVDGKPQPVMVRVGVSDGSVTEVAGDISEGDTIVVGGGRNAS
jgi:HlyD family secretion protein